MIKNIVFDFGNVIIKWDINSILEKYAIHDVESKKLKEIIFESEEWLQLDEGIINKGQAEKIFQDKAPDNLKNQVRNCAEITYTICLSFSPIAPVKNQLHSPLCA